MARRLFIVALAGLHARAVTFASATGGKVAGWMVDGRANAGVGGSASTSVAAQ